MELWIDKYKPKRLADISGQNKSVEKVQGWLAKWKQGSGLLIFGPTGSGKSLIAETIGFESNWLVMQLNASEINTGLIEEVSRGSKTKALFHKGKLVVVDELEGVSGRDKGVMPAILALVKESKYPVILISSDPYLQKLSSVKEHCESIKLDKVAVPSIVKKLKEISKEEGIEAEEDTLKTLAKFSQGDLRSAINDFQIVCAGKKKLEASDLVALGFREREQSVFNILQPIFHSRSLSVGRNAMSQSDKDPDEVFWWVENNILAELKTPEEILAGYNLLAAADIFRGRISKQQNWRFKAIASDLVSGISVFKKTHTGFVMYRPPQKFIQLGRSKAQRAETEELCEELGQQLHCSKRQVRKSYLPFLKFFK